MVPGNSIYLCRNCSHSQGTDRHVTMKTMKRDSGGKHPPPPPRSLRQLNKRQMCSIPHLKPSYLWLVFSTYAFKSSIDLTGLLYPRET